MKVIDTYNAVAGSIVAVLSAIFGQYWFLFALFLLFNVLDWLTGWYKSRKLGKESSAAGLAGILKKLGYWAVIIVAFSMPLALIQLGNIVGIDLGFLELIGWFTLASLLINEIRSILENLVETGYNVPAFLVKGLAVTEKLMNKGIEYIEKEK